MFMFCLSVVKLIFHFFIISPFTGKYNNIDNLDIRYALLNIPVDRLEQICCRGMLLLV